MNWCSRGSLSHLCITFSSFLFLCVGLEWVSLHFGFSLHLPGYWRSPCGGWCEEVVFPVWTPGPPDGGEDVPLVVPPVRRSWWTALAPSSHLLVCCALVTLQCKILKTSFNININVNINININSNSDNFDININININIYTPERRKGDCRKIWLPRWECRWSDSRNLFGIFSSSARQGWRSLWERPWPGPPAPLYREVRGVWRLLRSWRSHTWSPSGSPQWLRWRECRSQSVGLCPGRYQEYHGSDPVFPRWILVSHQTWCWWTWRCLTV